MRDLRRRHLLCLSLGATGKPLPRIILDWRSLDIVPAGNNISEGIVDYEDPLCRFCQRDEIWGFLKTGKWPWNTGRSKWECDKRGEVRMERW